MFRFFDFDLGIELRLVVLAHICFGFLHGLFVVDAHGIALSLDRLDLFVGSLQFG
jgi:hypothetical protein